MKNKQGCIDWLVEEINKQKAWADPSKLEPIIEKAKAMHKEEIESAIIYAEREHNILGNVWPTQTVLDKAQDYYNETFGGEN